MWKWRKKKSIRLKNRPHFRRKPQTWWSSMGRMPRKDIVNLIQLSLNCLFFTDFICDRSGDIGDCQVAPAISQKTLPSFADDFEANSIFQGEEAKDVLLDVKREVRERSAIAALGFSIFLLLRLTSSFLNLPFGTSGDRRAISTLPCRLDILRFCTGHHHFRQLCKPLALAVLDSRIQSTQNIIFNVI